MEKHHDFRSCDELAEELTKYHRCGLAGFVEEDAKAFDDA